MTISPIRLKRVTRLIAKRADRPRSEAVAMQTPDDDPHLETVAECDQRNEMRIAGLIDRLPDIAIALEASNIAALCGLIICALSSRRFRRAFMRKLYKFHKAQPGYQEYATIYLESIPEGSLATLGVETAIDRLRQRLNRSGFKGSILAGGVEVAWLYRSREWLLHIHVLTFGVPKAAWDALELKLADSGRSDPLRRGPLTRPKTRISYALKFVTYYKTGRSGPNGRAEKQPLWRNQLVELAEFWSRYRFDDFVFLYGAKRHGGNIVPKIRPTRARP
jgi:hypothetical protein